MIKFKANLVPIIVFLFIFAFTAGIGTETATAGETPEELKARLWKTTDVLEQRNIIGIFNALPGPNAAMAQVLLDYLKYGPGIDIDPGIIIGALDKLMTDEQISQLAKDIGAYYKADADTAYLYLVPVLAARIDNPNDLTSALVSLQFPEAYLYSKLFMQQVWSRVFTAPEEAVRWLDQIYTELGNSKARRSLVQAVGILAQKQLDRSHRVAVTDWLWRAQEKETDAVYRCDQLFTLYRLGESKALGALDDLYTGLSSAEERADLIQIIAGSSIWSQESADQSSLIDWLWKVAATDTSPYCRQQCLAILYTDLGQAKALEQFVRDTDQNGVAARPQEEQDYHMSSLDWQLLRDACQKYPQSFLGRGIKAYEEVRGQSYFEIDRPEETFEVVWVPSYGDEQYNPNREIPGWENFLAEFPGHPATDDATYRLARCYEITGRFADAIKTMQKARFSPDGDMSYATDGRLIYILDVRMTYDQLKTLPLEELEPPLRALADYTLAVKEIRRNNYTQAALKLNEFLKHEEEPADRYPLPFDRLSSYNGYDFYGLVKNQLAEVKELAAWQAQWEKAKEPAVLYDLAAAIFHNQMLYYNHLWAGERQSYNWMGYINTTGHGRAPAEMGTFAREMINYNHSLPYFQQVYQNPLSPPELKAKALYSAGLSYIGLDQWGEDASFGFNLTEITGKIISTYRQFVQEYPDNSMADDALLVLGTYTGDAAYLQRILKEYPEGDMLAKAQQLLKDMESPYYRPGGRYHGWSVPFKIMSPDDQNVPQEIKEWVSANTAQSFSGSKKTLGEWSYLLISAGGKPTAGYSVGIIDILGDTDKLKVYYRIDVPPPGQATAQVITYPNILIRIPANAVAVEFVKENPS